MIGVDVLWARTSSELPWRIAQQYLQSGLAIFKKQQNNYQLPATACHLSDDIHNQSTNQQSRKLGGASRRPPPLSLSEAISKSDLHLFYFYDYQSFSFVPKSANGKCIAPFYERSKEARFHTGKVCLVL